MIICDMCKYCKLDYTEKPCFQCIQTNDRVNFVPRYAQSSDNWKDN